MSGSARPGVTTTPTSLLSDLQAIVGANWVRTPPGDDSFTVDGTRPSVGVAPGTYEEVAAVMRYANDRRLAVIPLGGGTIKHVGNVPRDYDIALVLGRLNAIIEHEPADLTVTCQAGITMTELQTQLHEVGQMTPFGVSSGPFETLGGRLAANYSPYRQAYGGPRDFTIGLRVVTADGRITRTGGKVVKNVAGYDLSKLYIGSFGTLGVIVEVSLRLLPRPQEWYGLAFELGSAAQACELAADVHRKGLSVVLQSIYNRPSPDGSFVWFVYLGGMSSGVQRSRVEITDVATRAGGVPSRFEPHAPDEWSDRGKSRILECRVSILPSKVPEFIQTLGTELPPGQFGAEPTLGSAWVRWWAIDEPKAVLERARDLVLRLGGSLTVTHCDPAFKHQIDVFGHPPPGFDLMRRVKQQFDPNGILSPGRFVGKL